jgi:DNA-binding NtrC family response regulator
MAHATVFVVDDEALVRWSLKERLARDGYVLEAASAATALEQAREGVDLILLDFGLPDPDGLAVLERVKELYPDTLVILMTAYSTIDNAVEPGALYINKPFDLDEVALLVEKALETSCLRREMKALGTARDARTASTRLSATRRPCGPRRRCWSMRSGFSNKQNAWSVQPDARSDSNIGCVSEFEARRVQRPGRRVVNSGELRG